MTDRNDPVVHVIEQLYAARFALADAYRHKEVEITSENEAKILPLLQNHLMARTQAHHVRVVTDLKRLFDLALRKQGIIAVSTELGAEMDAMDIELVQLQAHEHCDNFDGVEHSLGEIRDRLYAIYDVLNISAIQMQQRVSFGFGVAENPAIRQRENEYYLKEIDRLIESFQQIRRSFEREAYTQSSAVRGLVSNIDVKCLSVIDRIRSIQDVIREHIFKQRYLEERGLKIRALGRYLRDRPTWRPEAAEVCAEQQASFLRPAALTVFAFPELNCSLRLQAALSAIVLQLQRQLKVRPEGIERQSSVIETVSQEARDTVIPICEKLMHAFLRYILTNRGGVSALKWLQDTDNLQSVSKDYWLYYVMCYVEPNRFLGRRRIGDIISAQLVTSSCDGFDNRRLEDVFVHPVSIGSKNIASEQGTNVLA